MKLEKGLQEFLDEAITESSLCTVEGSFSRMLTTEELTYMNEILKPYGYTVNCYLCVTCAEYSNGKTPYHIERMN